MTRGNGLISRYGPPHTTLFRPSTVRYRCVCVWLAHSRVGVYLYVSLYLYTCTCLYLYIICLYLLEDYDHSNDHLNIRFTILIWSNHISEWGDNIYHRKMKLSFSVTFHQNTERERSVVIIVLARNMKSLTFIHMLQYLISWDMIVPCDLLACMFPDKFGKLLIVKLKSSR